MSNNDFISRFLFDETDIRGEITALEKSFQDSIAHQEIPQSLVPLFGEFLAGTALLAEVLKFEGTLTLQARGEGDISIIMVETTDEGLLRGILQTREGLAEDYWQNKDIHLGELLGNAILSITIDPKKGKRYQGIIPVEHAKLAECLEAYFQQSEQLPTQIQLFANETHCGGLFLQCLPAQLVTDAEQREDHWQTCIQLAVTISQDELFSLQNEEMLLRLFHEQKCRVFPPKKLSFRCICDKERSGTALKSLGYDDAIALVREREIININCQFCGKSYEFRENDVDDIFLSKGKTLH